MKIKVNCDLCNSEDNTKIYDTKDIFNEVLSKKLCSLQTKKI